MSMHTHHPDYFASSFDGTIWPAVLVIAAMFASPPDRPRPQSRRGGSIPRSAACDAPR